MSGIALPGVFKGSPSSLNMSNMPVNMSSTGSLYQTVPPNSHPVTTLPSSSRPPHPTPPMPTLQPKVEAPDTGPEITKEEPKDESPEVDIVINNVVCSFSVRCHLNLKEIALNGSNVEYRRENGMVTMKLRHPYTTASIWSSGKITCTGANSEDQARVSARKFSRILQKLDDKYKDIRIKNWRIVNVLGTCTLPFAIKITPFSQAFREASYEPELHPGVTYKIKYPKATLKIFSAGSITVTAPSVANVEAAIKHIYPKVFDFQKKKEPEDIKKPLPDMSSVKRKSAQQNGYKIKKPNINFDDEDEEELSD